MNNDFINEYQKQLVNWQKQLFDTWLENLKATPHSLNPQEAYEKTLSYQEELLQTSFKVQEVTNQAVMESQKQFWDNYFEFMKKTATPAA
ncbi:conserved hypothetical protein [Planktothrix serta PCC 8927]|uniref:Thylakoid-associated protein n=1 Tax=Planktothrix serta PCC 8927 TaxID=671068 RepID=A0A7Z9DWT4_9CYAN|nr:hypothetical protein [Planktothrix serta]VXD15549.1 conserved hypothetical protein [Planktothrix serta PCC 8927]